MVLELPPEWEGYLAEHAPFFASLKGEMKKRFLDYLKVFVWEKTFIPAGGMELTDEVKVVISAAAVRLILNLDLSYYDRLHEIVVYPHDYRHPDRTGRILGEVGQFGSVVLSWPAVLHGLRNQRDGLDTAVHEFAHVLDLADGGFDGTPKLHRFGDYQPWARVMSSGFLALRRHRGRSVLRKYGATDEAEFFAVATEVFFERPKALLKQYPDVYAELSRFYHTDPAQPN